MTCERFCYWSIGDGPYALMLRALVASARAVGVEEDFHLWCDCDIPSAECHPLPKFDKRLYLFKFEFLRDYVAKLDYDYYVFLDADTWFVRHPGNLLRALDGAPVHVCLESDCTVPDSVRPDWWGCLLPQFVELMRESGVRSRSVFNTNAGFWIVHREAVSTFMELAFEFWRHAASKGYEFTEEAPLAYVGQMLVGDPYRHRLLARTDLWASDWTGAFAGRLPADETWKFSDYMTGQPYTVSPAIVHAMRSKQELVDFGRKMEKSVT